MAASIAAISVGAGADVAADELVVLFQRGERLGQWHGQ